MQLTRNKVRRTFGLLIGIVGISLFFFPYAFPFHKIANGSCWLFISGILCVYPDGRIRFTRHKITLLIAALISLVGFFFTLCAFSEFFAALSRQRPHGWARFDELIGIGPLLLTTGIVWCLSKEAE